MKRSSKRYTLQVPNPFMKRVYCSFAGSSSSNRKKKNTGGEIHIFHGWVVLAAEFASPLDNVLDKALQCEHPLNRWTKGPKWMGIGMPPRSNTTPGWRVRVYLDIIESQQT